MASWTFSLDAVAPDRRAAAWIDVLGRLGLPVSDPGSMAGGAGAVTVATAPMGTEFALMEAAPQVFSGRNAPSGSSVWLVAVLSGEGVMGRGTGAVPVSAGVLILGAPGIDTTLRVEAPSRLLFVRFPEVAVGARLVAPVERAVRTVRPGGGFEQLVFDHLASVARHLGDVGDAHLQAIEQATIELLVAMLASGGVAARGGAAGARANHLRRLCQRIEARLTDPELSIARVAADDGISPRYLQTLFNAAGLKFSDYVRERRLERCHADLVSPIHAQLSVAEIGYRWGFGDAPHFSRAFRARFGVPPSVHRQRGAG